MGAATIIGISAAPAVAGAAPVNLIQNGNFVPATPTTGYETPLVGDSSAISPWTVDGATGGSVDVVSSSYWTNVSNAPYSIDLAGSTGVPGGVSQIVTTTPGVEYQLSFWSAVNGDEAAGNSHERLRERFAREDRDDGRHRQQVVARLGAEHGELHRILDQQQN